MMALVVLGAAALGLALIAIGARRGSGTTTAAALAEARLARLESIGPQPKAADDEFSQPLPARVGAPLLEPFVRLAQRYTPAARSAELDYLLDVAGNPGGLDAIQFQSLRLVAGIVGALVLMMLAVLFGQVLLAPLFGLLGLLAGIFVPTIWLTNRISERRWQIEQALPEALDIVTVCLEAGLTFDTALQRIGDNVRGPLGHEVRRALKEVELGKPRAAALENLARRSGLEEMSTLVRTIDQAQRSGVPLVRIIRIHAEQMRMRRRNRVRTQTAQAALKMMLPTVGCVFPVLWIVILGPAVLLLLKLSH
jgi:tight adherence protein C